MEQHLVEKRVTSWTMEISVKANAISVASELPRYIDDWVVQKSIWGHHVSTRRYGIRQRDLLLDLNAGLARLLATHNTREECYYSTVKC